MAKKSILKVWLLLGSSFGVAGLAQVYIASGHLGYGVIALFMGILIGLVGGLIRIATLERHDLVELEGVASTRLRLLAASLVLVLAIAASVAWNRGASRPLYGALILTAVTVAVVSQILLRRE